MTWRRAWFWRPELGSVRGGGLNAAHAMHWRVRHEPTITVLEGNRSQTVVTDPQGGSGSGGLSL